MSDLAVRSLLAFVAAAVATVVLVPAVRALGHRLGLVDAPGGRKVHHQPVPYLGGVAIFAVVVATFSTSEGFGTRLTGVIAAGLLLGAVGLADDRRPLGVEVRLVTQVTAAALVTAGGVHVVVTDIAAVDVVLTILWLVAITNALNLLDNTDGVAATVAALSSAGIAFLAVGDGQRLIAVAAAGLAGACVGFLVFNARRASIYLGDNGATFLGFVLAVLSVEVNSQLPNPTSYLVPIGLLAVPILDTTTVVIRRVRQGVSPFTPGRDHLAHRIAARAGPGRALVVLSLAQAACVVLAVLAGEERLAPAAALAGSLLVLGALLVTARGVHQS